MYGIHNLKVDIRTNKPLNVQFRYASGVSFRYKTDHRLVLVDCEYYHISPVKMCWLQHLTGACLDINLVFCYCIYLLTHLNKAVHKNNYVSGKAAGWLKNVRPETRSTTHKNTTITTTVIVLTCADIVQ